MVMLGGVDGSECGNSAGMLVRRFYCASVLVEANRGASAFVRSRLSNPRACLTLTLTFRDDPRLEDLLERTSVRRSLDGAPADIVAEEDEYMIESFDGMATLLDR